MDTYCVSTLPQLAASLPYLLGYTPKNALVAVCFRDLESAVTIAWRERAESLEADREGARMAFTRAVEAGANHVMLLSVDAKDGGDWIRLAAAVCRDLGLSVRHRATVRGTALTDLDTGETHDVPPLTDREAAPFVLAGVAPLPSREDVAALFEAVSTEAVTYALAETAHTLTEAVRAWAAILDPQGEPVEALPAEIIARASTALLDVSTRDGLLWRMIPGTPESVAVGLSPEFRALVEALPAPSDGREALTVAERLRVMATRMCDEDATPTLTAAAAIYWAAGDGSRAACALDRALRAHPGYALALLLHRLVANGIRTSNALV